MTTREIALSYLEKGLSVIPMKSPAIVKRSMKFKQMVQAEFENNKLLPNPRTEKEIYEELFLRECKKPLLGWKEYQDRLPTVDEVNNWFNMNPEANIGIITGAISNLVVFDLDSDAAVQYAEELGGFPEYTVKVKSRRGYHIYMRHPGFNVKNQVSEKLEIDIRADGGLIMAPPSTHGSGSQYQWAEGFSMFQIDPAECTPWMIDYLKEVTRMSSALNKKQTKAETIPANQKEIKANEYLDLLKNDCPQGERNHATTKLIGHLLKTGMKGAEIWELFQLWNETKVKPLWVLVN